MGGGGAGNQWDMVLIMGVKRGDGIKAQLEGGVSRRAEGDCFPCDGPKATKDLDRKRKLRH